jgi:hypothetical protein
VGVTGDFVPPREVLRPRFLARLLVALVRPAPRAPAAPAPDGAVPAPNA